MLDRWFPSECEDCRWTGSSEYLGITCGWDDEEAYCPCCYSNAVDECEPPEGETNFSAEHSIKEIKRIKEKRTKEALDGLDKINIYDYCKPQWYQRVYAAFYVFLNFRAYRKAVRDIQSASSINIPTQSKGEA